MIYIIKAQNRVKVGYSKHATGRVAGIQRVSPYRLRVLAVTSGDVEQERYFHSRLANSRCHGEWFDAKSAELSSLLQEIELGLWSPLEKERKGAQAAADAAYKVTA